MYLSFFQNSLLGQLITNILLLMIKYIRRFIILVLFFLEPSFGAPTPLAFIWSGCSPDWQHNCHLANSSVLGILILGFLCLSLLWLSPSKFFKYLLIAVGEWGGQTHCRWPQILAEEKVYFLESSVMSRCHFQEAPGQGGTVQVHFSLPVSLTVKWERWLAGFVS